MRERPILFSAPMVRAILEGRKTQTRRVVKWKDQAAGLNLSFTGLATQRFEGVDGPSWGLMSRRGDGCWEERSNLTRCPYGQPGDRLWVKETFAHWLAPELFSCRAIPVTAYRAGKQVRIPPDGVVGVPIEEWELRWVDDRKRENVRWKPSIHMPRRLSRITLEVTAVRVERLQDISQSDARAEGVEAYAEACRKACKDVADYPFGLEPADWFELLWSKINGRASWDANPWVWAITFREVQHANQ